MSMYSAVTNIATMPPDRLAATVRYGNAANGAALAPLADPNSNPKCGGPRPAASASRHLSWKTYDAEGRVTQITAGDGSVVTYDYDASGRLIQTAQRAKQLGALALALLKQDGRAAWRRTCSGTAKARAPHL